MPNATSVTAIAAWMLICILYVFSAFACYSFLLWRLKPQLMRKGWNYVPTAPTTTSCEDVEREAPSTPHSQKIEEASVLRLDDKFLVAFPVLFVITLAVYWGTCLAQASSMPDVEEVINMLDQEYNNLDAQQFMYR